MAAARLAITRRTAGICTAKRAVFLVWLLKPEASSRALAACDACRTLVNMQHRSPGSKGTSLASSPTPSRPDTEVVWRTGCSVGSLRLRRGNTRPRVAAFYGPLLGQRFPAHGVVSRLGLPAIG